MILKLLTWLIKILTKEPLPPIENLPEAAPPEKVEKMADFAKAINIILAHEGGYQNNKYDKGNYVCAITGSWVQGGYPYHCHQSQPLLIGTKFGIAAPVLAKALNRVPSVLEMKNLTRASAQAVYKSQFWDRIKGDFISNQEVANIFFDGAVNHGVSRGTKMMQEALKVNQDGIVGAQTLNAINTVDPAFIYNDYKRIRWNFYHEIVQNRPDQNVFLKGWLKRIESFTAFSNQGSSTGIGIAIAILLPALLFLR